MPSGIQTSSLATAGNVTQLEALYNKKLWYARTYDLYAEPVSKLIEPKGTTVQRSWLAKLTPQPTASIGVEDADFTPQAVRDYSDTMTKVWRADGLKAHELVGLTNSLGIEREFVSLVADLAAETLDLVAAGAATEGNNVIYGDGTHTTRATLDLGTAGDRMNVDRFFEIRGMLGQWMNEPDGKSPLFATITNWQYHDLLNTSSSIITDKMKYDGGADSALFNYELGSLAGIRINVSPFARVFYGAGANNGSAVATTLNGAVTAGAKTIVVAANTNIVAGMYLTIGTVQSSTQSDANLITEVVRVASTPGSTTVTIVGQGNGGLKYDHATGAAVENGDSAHCAVFGLKDSMAVAFDGYGRYGKLVTPFLDGNARQWNNYAFKAYLGYKVFDESKLARVETSSSRQ